MRKLPASRAGAHPQSVHAPQWRLRWVQFSTWGEVVGWARPDEYPPRNDRTLKGLRALGYPVRGV